MDILMAGVSSALGYLLLLAIWTPIKWLLNSVQPDDKKIETNHMYVGITALLLLNVLRSFQA